MACALMRRRSGGLLDAALLAARRMTTLASSAIEAPRPPAPPPLHPFINPSAIEASPSRPSASPPTLPYAPSFVRGISSPTKHGPAAMGRNLTPSLLWDVRAYAGGWRYYSSKPSQNPKSKPPAKNLQPNWKQSAVPKKSEQYSKQKPEPASQSHQNPKKANRRRRRKKKQQQQQQQQPQLQKQKKKQEQLVPLRRIPVWRSPLYGPKIKVPSTTHLLKLSLAAKGIDCFGEADFYQKFNVTEFVTNTCMLIVKEVPGSNEKDKDFAFVPDDMKRLIRSLIKILAMLHESGYCILEDFDVDDLMISGHFQFFLKGHLTLVACTTEGIDRDYARASKVIRKMFLVSCGETMMPLIPMEMTKFLELLESCGHKCVYLILTNVALLPLSSRGDVLRKFHDEILEVLPKEGQGAIKDKILNEIDISSWNMIASENKHLTAWYHYRDKKGMGKPYDPKKPSHFLSLQRNVISHKDAKMVSEVGAVDLLLYACYPIQLSQLQLSLWKYDRLGHLYVEENFNDGCATLTGSMPKCAPKSKNSCLQTGRAAKEMPFRIISARIACLDFSLQKEEMQSNTLEADPQSLKKTHQRGDIKRHRIERILKAGANVILTTKGLDEISVKCFVEAKVIAVRRVRKGDLYNVAKDSGATVVSSAHLEHEETFDPSFLGYADEVVEERIAGRDVILVKGANTSNMVGRIQYSKLEAASTKVKVIQFASESPAAIANKQTKDTTKLTEEKSGDSDK